jgi:hypothetical protein
MSKVVMKCEGCVEKQDHHLNAVSTCDLSHCAFDSYFHMLNKRVFDLHKCAS